MTPSLAQSRCFQHVSREAVARCPECQRFYCRECVTEHEGRMICRACLDALLLEQTVESSSFFKTVRAWLLAGCGYVFAVYVFYQIGCALLRIPSEFHSGVFFE